VSAGQPILSSAGRSGSGVPSLDRVDDVDGRLERTIGELLDQRRPGASICPSDAARAVDGESWRDLMPAARAAAGRLVEAGEVEVTQGGEVVDVATTRGPVRIRRPRSAPSGGSPRACEG
jgi:hypothetical protein